MATLLNNMYNEQHTLHCFSTIVSKSSLTYGGGQSAGAIIAKFSSLPGAVIRAETISQLCAVIRSFTAVTSSRIKGEHQKKTGTIKSYCK